MRGPDAEEFAGEWLSALDEADLPIGSASFVGDIAMRGVPELRDDGAVFVAIEALTLDA